MFTQDQAPSTQVSRPVQESSSLQVAPSGDTARTQAPVAPSQVFTWQGSSVGGQMMGVPATTSHLPPGMSVLQTTTPPQMVSGWAQSPS